MDQSVENTRPHAQHGVVLLNDPARNKGTAFAAAERAQYGLEGLLPPSVESLDRQTKRVMRHLDVKPNDLERHGYLIGLLDRNETLLYHTVMPAIGLATYAARPRRITDECFIVAAEATADQVDSYLRAKGMLFPNQADILETE